MVSKETEKQTDLTANLSASTSPFGKAGHTGLDSLERDYSESEIIMNQSLAEAIRSGAGAFRSRAGDRNIQGGFPELGKPQESAETHQEPAALRRESG